MSGRKTYADLLELVDDLESHIRMDLRIRLTLELGKGSKDEKTLRLVGNDQKVSKADLRSLLASMRAVVAAKGEVTA